MLEEELDQIEETAQQSEADASSELVTQSIVSQKRQKYEIYLKLLRMLFLPFPDFPLLQTRRRVFSAPL